MGERVELKAVDGHTLGGYVAAPATTPIGGVVLLQEIFGVNAHIRSVVDRYAEAGYVAIAPALFDRVERDVELTYESQNTQTGIGLMQKLDFATTLNDVAAAFDHVAASGVKVGVVGFLLWRSVELADGDPRKKREHPASLLRWVLRWGYREVCWRGAGLSCDAALWRGGYAHRAGSD